ncbi:5-oxoprolinase, partial [archaeon]|nr:5-oxoprolinase [archaeon]
IIVERYALNTEDGTGHGTFRGGFGAVRNYRLLCSEASFTVSAGRSKFPCWGVDGGMKGTPNYAIIYKQGEEPMRVRKIAAHKLRKGDMVSLITGGGGGWGDPAKRDPERVLWDVKNEYVTLEDALNIYGVAIDGKTLELNLKKTEKLRKAKG